jgi:signal peptidase I
MTDSRESLTDNPEKNEGANEHARVNPSVSADPNAEQSASGSADPSGSAKRSATGGAVDKPGKADRLTAPGVVIEVGELVVVTFALLIVIRGLLVEPRFIPSSSMEPSLRTEDRLLVEKISKNLGKEAQRGDILVFYPPPSQLPGGKDLSSDPATVIGRLTGLPFLPYEPAFIKRVIGLPGDKVRVKRGVGVFINERLLNETSYVQDPPAYDLVKLGDIGRATIGDDRRPYKDRPDEPIIVPPGMLFMLGDNRNNSEDSHVWGFLDQNRVIGRAWLLFWRLLEPPKYSEIINQQTPGG